MTRLGLSDSMRSDVALEDTEPLHTATHRRTPRRPRAAPPTAGAEASSEQRRRTKSALFKPFRSLFGAVLGVVLVFAALQGLLSTLSIWKDTSVQVAAQFEHMETRISLLGRDATRLKTTADAFLKRCLEAQVAASTRTEMLQTSARKNVEEQTKTQLQEHAEVVKEVMKYYAQQEQEIHETRERLMKMNVTLPVQITMRQVSESWEKEQRLLGDGDVLDQQQEVADDRLENAVEKLSFIAERTLEEAGSGGRLSVEHIVIQRNSETSEVETRSHRQATSQGSIVVFYAFVVFVSASYLWTAVSRSGKKELKDNKVSWSPVPKVLGRLKALLTSVVVIEDLRESNSESSTSHNLEHVEQIDF